jgi:hypothetical protein
MADEKPQVGNPDELVEIESLSGMGFAMKDGPTFAESTKAICTRAMAERMIAAEPKRFRIVKAIHPEVPALAPVPKTPAGSEE